MEKTLEQRAESILKEDIKNIDLISYFCKSTKKTPIFLSDIQRKYAEIIPLLKEGLIKDENPVKSYIFNIDKFENFFYQKYQGIIDLLKGEIWKRKRKKNELVQMTETLEPEAGSSDYDQKLREVLEFAKKSIQELDKMELEKEEFNNEVGGLQDNMKQDLYYKFLFFIHNDKDIVFNKRTEDDEGKIHKKLLIYLNECTDGKGWNFFKELKNKNFLKEYSPAKNYYITKLGVCVDHNYKRNKWEQDEDYQKTDAEIAQEKEFNEFLNDEKRDIYFSE